MTYTSRLSLCIYHIIEKDLPPAENGTDPDKHPENDCLNSLDDLFVGKYI